MPSLEVPVMRGIGSGGPEEGGELVNVQVWNDTCKGVDQGLPAALWLRKFLEMVRLFV